MKNRTTLLTLFLFVTFVVISSLGVLKAQQSTGKASDFTKDNPIVARFDSLATLFLPMRNSPAMSAN
jgi:hypothetical protein